MGIRMIFPFFYGFSGEDYWLKMFFVFFSRAGRCTSYLQIRPIAWILGYLKMLNRRLYTYFLWSFKRICFLFLFCDCQRDCMRVWVRHFLMSFLVEVTFMYGRFWGDSILFGGILYETEELSVWDGGYWILKSFSLIFLRSEWLIFLY